ncbi:MAG: hypothetical protein CMQ61_11625 [Gammaproteobacteria bacterium]|nr:hypothetical protein [Gammaproteobacteria bacterium]
MKETAVDTSPLLYDLRDGVVTLTLNRPEVLNAFSDELRVALHERLQALAEDDAARVVVITGTGRAFSAGGDIANMVDLQARNDTSTLPGRIDVAGKVMATIRAMPKPVVAAINGPAAGGGLNLALGCDIRLGSTEAVFSQAFVKIGLVPDWGGFHALTRLVGTGKATELMMTGERIDATEAYRLGLLNQLYEADVFAAKAQKFAKRLAASPRAALAYIKQGVAIGATGNHEDVVAFERRVQSELFLSADACEGMQAFLEKRPPKFE